MDIDAAIKKVSLAIRMTGTKQYPAPQSCRACFSRPGHLSKDQTADLSHEDRAAPAKRPWQRAGAKLCKSGPKPELP